jgi:hypothetical protein
MCWCCAGVLLLALALAKGHAYQCPGPIRGLPAVLPACHPTTHLFNITPSSPCPTARHTDHRHDPTPALLPVTLPPCHATILTPPPSLHLQRGTLITAMTTGPGALDRSLRLDRLRWLDSVPGVPRLPEETRLHLLDWYNETADTGLNYQ